MKKSIAIAIVLAVLAVASLNYHIILTDDGVHVLKKTRLSFSKTLVDARGAKAMKLFLDPDLRGAGIQQLLRDIGAAN